MKEVWFVSLFPEMFEGPLSCSIVGRARTAGLLNVETLNPRDFAFNKHGSVDDYPFGGGAGMVIRPEPLFRAVEHIKRKTGSGRVILMTPSGKRFEQVDARRLAGYDRLIFVCGHYEGVDERVRENIADECLSIGDYVLTGGELPAMVVVDAVARLQDGVLGSPESYADESFSGATLEYPQYTRPRSYRGHDVPETLLNGDHARIKQWRAEAAKELTSKVRPDLIDDNREGG